MPIDVIIAILIVVLPVAYFVLKPLLRRRQKERIMGRPFPHDWKEILRRNLPIYRHLPDPIRDRLHRLIHLFLEEKTIEGCQGIEVDDEIRVTVAAQACLLVVNRQGDCYPALTTVLVYPTAYVVRDRPIAEMVYAGKVVELGESWRTGAVVISWDNVNKGTLDPGNAVNVAIHEFTHHLDMENGEVDGIPLLATESAYAEWEEVMDREYEKLVWRTEQGTETIIDEYGMTNEVEFFAVAVEAFLERPAALRRRYPDLYRQFSRYFQLDPAEWAPDQGEQTHE